MLDLQLLQASSPLTSLATLEFQLHKRIHHLGWGQKSQGLEDCHGEKMSGAVLLMLFVQCLALTVASRLFLSPQHLRIAWDTDLAKCLSQDIS